MKRLTLALTALALVAGCRSESTNTAGELGPAPPAQIKRLVTLAPSLTDLVLALDAGDRLVGVTRFDDALAVKSLPRVGGYNDPSLETIVRLAPDLVVCQPAPGNKGSVHAVAEAGISVRFFGLETLSDIRKTTLELGHLLDREDAAQALVSRIDEARRKARAAADKRSRRPKVALLVGIDPLIAAGPGSFSHELLVDAGADNIVERSPQSWPHLSPERLLGQAPDAILLVDVEHGADPARLPESLRAKVVTLKNTGLLQPSSGVIGSLEELTAVFDRVVADP